MNFHLSFPIKPFIKPTSYANKHLFIGSCFAENIGDKMAKHKFNVSINPNGILYNPSSIATTIHRLIENKSVSTDELFSANEQWHHWEYHSDYSNSDKDECLTAINKSIFDASAYLKDSNWLLITFGSAFQYHHIESNTGVGNCHKVPQKEFDKKMLSINEMVNDYRSLIEDLKSFNPKLNILFTVSPVRYIRDGVVENNISKARLIETVHQLVSEHDNAFYFPAYELVIDDLRDYRFYKKDLVHPSEQAIDYVFEKLQEALFDEKTQNLLGEISKIITAQNHRPIHPDSEAHQQFKNKISKQIKAIKKQYPLLNF